MKIKGTALFVKALNEEGVDTIFGYPGGFVTDIFDELYQLESLAILLKTYCLNNTCDISSLSDTQRKALYFEKNNCINITELAIKTIEKLKTTSEKLEQNVFSLNQYTNNCRR